MSGTGNRHDQQFLSRSTENSQDFFVDESAGRIFTMDMAAWDSA